MLRHLSNSDVALRGPDWCPEQVLGTGVAIRALLEGIRRRGGARSGVFAPGLTRKSELQAAAVHAWASETQR